MTVAEKLNLIAENEQRVYDAGFEKGTLQGGGTFWEDFVRDRTDWSYVFQGWGHEYIQPSLQIKPTSTYYSFYKCVNLKELNAEHFDFSNATPSDTTSGSGNNRTFYNCKNLEYIEDIGLPSGYYIRTFENCLKLHTIHALRCNKETGWNNAFAGCGKLVDILNIIGEIGQNGFDVSKCPLSHDTLMRIINALADYSSEGGTHTITFGAINLAKLTDAEKAIATQKGWTLA